MTPTKFCTRSCAGEEEEEEDRRQISLCSGNIKVGSLIVREAACFEGAKSADFATPSMASTGALGMPHYGIAKRRQQHLSKRALFCFTEEPGKVTDGGWRPLMTLPSFQGHLPVARGNRWNLPDASGSLKQSSALERERGSVDSRD